MDHIFSSDFEELAKQIFGSEKVWKHETLADHADAASNAHNQGEIDLLKVVFTDFFEQLEGRKFFSGQHFFCEVIPKLSASVDEVMKTVEALVSKAGEDLAANQPNAAFKAWLTEDIQRSQTVITKAEANEELAIKHATFALQASNDLDRALQWLEAYADTRQVSAIAALGRLDFGSNRRAIEVLERLGSVAKKTNDDVTMQNIVGAMFAIAHSAKCLKNSRFSNELSVCLCDPGPGTQYQLATALWQHADALPLTEITKVLGALEVIKSEHGGTLTQIDLALTKIWQAGHVTECIDFFAKLVQPLGKVDDEQFTNFLRAVLADTARNLGDAYVMWFKTGAYILCDCVASAFRSERDGAPNFDLAGNWKSLSDDEALFVARKAVGFFFFSPRVASKFLIAAIRQASPNLTEELTELLFNPLALNFGGSVPEELKKVEPTDPAHGTTQGIIDRYTAYRAGRTNVGDIKEFQPSERQRQIEWQKRNAEMRKIQKEAMRQSVFFDLVSHSTLLYGKSSRSFHDDLAGGRKMTQTPMQTHTTSFELPQLQIFDPTGLNFMLRMFQNEKLKS
ncbi:hypothetical protein [Sulfitobacter pacificus]|uniref:hypothetical protein n=1 Tax=Sulfitobacter pacificus TaxID=1499314 RepID=UPI00310884D4